MKESTIELIMMTEKLMQTTTTAPTILITKATTYAIITSLNSSTGHNKRPTIIIYPSGKHLIYTLDKLHKVKKTS